MERTSTERRRNSPVDLVLRLEHQQLAIRETGVDREKLEFFDGVVLSLLDLNEPTKGIDQHGRSGTSGGRRERPNLGTKLSFASSSKLTSSASYGEFLL